MNVSMMLSFPLKSAKAPSQSVIHGLLASLCYMGGEVARCHGDFLDGGGPNSGGEKGEKRRGAAWLF